MESTFGTGRNTLREIGRMTGVSRNTILGPLGPTIDEIGIPFLWVGTPAIVLGALGCIVLASITGAVGALYPAWRASRRDAYDLIRGAT